MDEKITLEEHDRKSEDRAASVKQTVRDEFHEHIEEPKMSTPMNIFNENPGMGGYGRVPWACLIWLAACVHEFLHFWVHGPVQ